MSDPTNRRRRRTATALASVVVGAAAGHIVTAGLGVGGPVGAFFSGPVHFALLAVAVLGCLSRAVIFSEERAAWLLLGLGVGAWALGEAHYSLFLAALAEPPYPSVSDALWLATPLMFYIALGLLTRARLRNVGRELWLDGLIGACAVAALGAAVVFKTVLEHTGGSPAEVAVNLAYPLSDLLLIGFVVGVFALTGWRPGRDWLWLFAGFAMLALADSIYLYRTASGAYVDGELVDALWPAAMLLLGWSAWQPARNSRPVALEGWPVVMLPVGFSAMALALLVRGNGEPIGALAVALATAALLGAMLRMAMTFREMRRLSNNRRRDAVTDALTGLGNRRKLLSHLDDALSGAARDHRLVLTLFDLDGFKSYNDTFGHPAGDGLLARLGHNLEAAVRPWGDAYRLGGDEFCAVFSPGDLDPSAVVAACVAALTEQGDGFSITASYGTVALPVEAAETARALQMADQRMYAHKDGRPSSPRYQMRDLLLKALDEQQPALYDHSSGVSGLVTSIARDMRLNERALDDVLRAAELHDVGKLAIPDAILCKPGPLDDEEWAFMRRHTVIGERILSAATALSTVARLVRGSHERWDGTGYPDRLAGEAIPLGSRIIAVCDAFDAMTTDRPYRQAMSAGEAMEELDHCAGNQFDPAVVEVFCRQMSRSSDRALASLRTEL